MIVLFLIKMYLVQNRELFVSLMYRKIIVLKRIGINLVYFLLNCMSAEAT